MNGLWSLNSEFVANLWYQSGKKAVEDCLGRETSDTVAQLFEVSLVFRNRAMLSEFKQFCLVIGVGGGTETKFKGFCEGNPIEKLVVLVHPLEPTKSFTLHVK